MIQHTTERLDRATEYLQQAAHVRGVARGLNDLADYLGDFTPGCDPAREAQAIAIATLHQMSSEAAGHAANLTYRAETLRQVVERAEEAEAMRELVDEVA